MIDLNQPYLFTGTKRKELVYRGSTRLGPLYREMQQRQKDGGAGGKHGRQHGNYQRNTNTPYVEYTRQSDLAGKAALIHFTRGSLPRS